MEMNEWHSDDLSMHSGPYLQNLVVVTCPAWNTCSELEKRLKTRKSSFKYVPKIFAAQSMWIFSAK